MTIELTVVAMLISLSIALPAGVISALHRNSALDVLSTMTALTGVSIPNFFLGILLIVAFARSCNGCLPQATSLPWKALPSTSKPSCCRR